MSSLVVSHSELQTYLRCKRKWWLGHYRKLTLLTEKPTGALMIGNLVHDALAHYYEFGDADAAKGMMQDKIDIACETSPEIEDDIRKDAELSQIMFDGYIDWLQEEGADQDLEVISTERAIRQPLTEGIELLGKLDIRVQKISDGAKRFVDHKTVGDFGSVEKTAHMNSQMLQYHLLEYLEMLNDPEFDPAIDRTDGGIFNMLRKVKRSVKAKPPFYKRHEVRHNVNALRSYWLRVYGIATDIKHTTDRLAGGEDHRTAAPPTPTRDCTWDCPFFSVCYMFDDGSDVESVIPMMYKVGDPYERYRELPQGDILVPATDGKEAP